MAEMLFWKRHNQLICVAFKADEKIAKGTDVLFDDQVVGKVIWSADDVSSNESNLGLMTIDKEFAHSGVHFVAESGQVLTTLSSPYRIPESWNK